MTTERHMQVAAELLEAAQKRAAQAETDRDTLAAEVRAWQDAEHLRRDEPHAEFMRLAEARARTRETQALTRAKEAK